MGSTGLWMHERHTEVFVYSAAKAYITRFLEAEHNRCVQKNIPVFVTELVAGWVNAWPSESDKQSANPSC